MVPAATHHEINVGILISEILHQLLEAVLLPTDLGGRRRVKARQEGMARGHPGGWQDRRYLLVTPFQS